VEVQARQWLGGMKMKGGGEDDGSKRGYLCYDEPSISNCKAIGWLYYTQNSSGMGRVHSRREGVHTRGAKPEQA
jgi:hypothetical protein